MTFTERAPLGLVEYTQMLTAGGVNVDTIAVDDKGTICADSLVTPAQEPQLGALGGAEIVVKHRLSRGGMGEILVAEQTSIGREVAVKRLRPDVPDPAAHEHELLIEARVAGRLEHPNIVPVHVVGRGEDGRTLLVMKRIEGRSWGAMMKEGRELERDVRILVDVCRALHFAHARGVVHRDVKPANVMVGNFGEVYLVDWGIAVGISALAPPEIPRADQLRSLTGTPNYMAPEMATPGNVVDVRTDTFLAGAVLYEIITGAPPWRRGTVEASLHAAYMAPRPRFPDDVPEELADICIKALSRDPALRYQTAEDLRLALEKFLSHAAARSLCKDAEQRLSLLLSLPEDADPAHTVKIFSECRFGFAQALRIWPGSQRAQVGLRSALQEMAKREIKLGAFDSARLLVAEIDEPSEGLTTALGALQERRANEARSVEELARVSREHDRDFAARERRRVLSLVGVGWLIVGVVVTVLKKAGVYDVGPGTVVAITAAATAAVIIAAIAVPRMRETKAARSALITMVNTPLSFSLFFAIGWKMGLPVAHLLPLAFVLVGAVLADRAAEDRRTVSAALLSWLGVAPMLMWPAYVELIATVTGCACSFAAAYQPETFAKADRT